ncbi:MAG: helix-turn-helix transcriptional regulator [Thermodesulfobacteriota bacterium]
MARGDQLGRQWTILKTILSSRNGMTALELAAAGGCSKRTVYRDIVALETAGFPLYTEKRRRVTHYCVLDSFKQTIPLPVTFPEMIALYAGQGMLRMFQHTIFYDALDSLFRKIEATLPPEMVASLGHLDRHYHMATRPRASYAKHREILNRINDCLIHRKCIDIMYHTMSRNAETKRTVSPYHVWFFNGTFYLIGHCHLRREVRMFAIDRIKLLAPTEECFEIPDEFDLAEFMRNSFGVFQGQPVNVRIWFAPEVSGFIKEKQWHASQKIRQNKDGSVIFEARVAGIDEIKFWVMSWGGKARVLAPESLRESVQREARSLLDHYLEEAGDRNQPRSA